MFARARASVVISRSDRSSIARADDSWKQMVAICRAIYVYTAASAKAVCAVRGDGGGTVLCRQSAERYDIIGPRSIPTTRTKNISAGE